MSGIFQFQFLHLFMFFENTPRFWEKNSEIRHRIEVKTFVFFSFLLWPAEVQKILYTGPCSKSLGTTAFYERFYVRWRCCKCSLFMIEFGLVTGLKMFRRELVSSGFLLFNFLWQKYPLRLKLKSYSCLILSFMSSLLLNYLN